MKLRHPLELYPIAFVVWTLLGILTTYAIGAKLEHFRAFIPAISQTGGLPPEKGIFTFVVTISGILFLIVTTIRFKQVLENRDSYRIFITILNVVGYVISLIVIFGMFLVGCFGITERQTIAIHVFGAFLVYFPGYLYYLVQLIIAPFLIPKNRWRWVVFGFRLALLILGAMLLIIHVTSLLEHYFTRDNNSTDTNTTAYHPSTAPPTPTQWNSQNNLITGSQWFMVAGFYALALTLVPEFYYLEATFTVRNRDKNLGYSETPHIN